MPLFQAIQVLKSQDVAIKGVHLCYNEQVLQWFIIMCCSRFRGKQQLFTCTRPVIISNIVVSTKGRKFNFEHFVYVYKIIVTRQL